MSVENNDLRVSLASLDRWRKLKRVPGFASIHIGRELLYQNMLYQALGSLKVPAPPMYPVGGAANFSLLYLILRIVTELRVGRVLEIGSGQSSMLLDAVQSVFPFDCVSVEQDAGWAETVSARVKHPVLLCPVEAQSGAPARFTNRGALGDTKFDFVIVDGPVGSPRQSRWAALEILRDHLAPEYVVLFDDAERTGEQDTIREFMKTHRGGCSHLNAGKSQFLAFTPAFASAGYF